MKKNVSYISRKCSVILLLLTVLFTLSQVSIFAQNNINNDSTDICVVYDNSASTYKDETWCRYKYVLEIMASLIDYENGSQMFIYPLCDVSIDGRSTSGSCDPVAICSYNDIGKITNMYTVSPANTPFEPVKEAYDFLVNVSSAKNKNLLILTDGEFNLSFENDSTITTEKRLNDLFNEMVDNSTVQIHYLGSGSATTIIPKENKGLYSHMFTGVVDSQELLNYAIGLCGKMFNQSELLKSKSELTQVNISNNCRIIVFANGENSSVSSLSTEKGVSLPFLYDTGRHKYSTTRATGFENAPLDKSLESYIIIFDSCEPGKYILECKNLDTASIYIQHEQNFSDSIDNPTTEEIRNKNDGNISTNHILVIAISFGITLITLIAFYIIHKRQQNKKFQVFISYRREGGYYLAGRIADRLKAIGYKTFFDVESMQAGAFNEQIYEAIDGCQNVILILSPNALDRCINDDDWVRKEIEYAIKKQKRIIPILMQGFEFPKTLPEKIDKIRNMEGVTVSKNYFEAVIEKIDKYLKCNKK